MALRVLLFCLAFRSLWLLLPQTYFQPDEFYQALEPAHHHVFGNGYLSWEWQDLPLQGDESWWMNVIGGGRMRGWIWPSVFVGIYRLLQITKLDNTFLLTWLPRLPGVIVAALTDYHTSRLSAKVLGGGSAAGALFLSMTSLFHAHLLPRALSTSPETLLTTIALYYFPLPGPSKPKTIIVGEEDGLAVSKSMQDLKEVKVSKEPRSSDTDTLRLEVVADLNYVVMDRIAGQAAREDEYCDNLPLSAALGTLAICIRPTTAPFWLYMGLEYIIRTLRATGPAAAAGQVLLAGTAAVVVLAASTAVDYYFTGRLMVPILTFLHQNIIQNISSFYGPTNKFYHLTQSLPIMLTTVTPWWLPGFLACLLPGSALQVFDRPSTTRSFLQGFGVVLAVRALPPRSRWRFTFLFLLPLLFSSRKFFSKQLRDLDRPAGLCALARGISVAVAVLSLSPHSEWRFVHPFLPPLLLFALPPMFKTYTPAIAGLYRLAQCIRQFTRIPKFPFYLCLLAPILPFLYLNTLHGRAEVAVMDVLRQGRVGEVTGLVALVPCHSTPWQSHLHRDIPAWFLTCEPPLEVEPEAHEVQQDRFYSAPVTYLQHVFPYPPDMLENVSNTRAIPMPSHLIVFGELLDRKEDTEDGVISVREELELQGYREVWQGWNGFDLLQDEAERRGGVRIWAVAEVDGP